MQATSEQIMSLIRLQHTDLTIAHIERQVDDLPQKQTLTALKEKQSAIQRKQRALIGGRKDLELNLESLLEEERNLVKRQDEAQQRINAASSDYKEVSSSSEALSTYAEDLEALRGRISSTETQILEISSLEPQVETMLARLSEKEKGLIASYREEGGKLLAKVASLKEEREALADAIGEQIMGHYNHIAKAKQGVALAHLNEGACNTCRTSFDQSRVLSLRMDYPLSFCPHCGRLMVIDKRYAG